MLLDARLMRHGETLHADVCVIGAGAAGLTLAHELARTNARVVVLESGGVMPGHDAQSLSAGVVAGEPYYPLEACRFRALGGTTVHWGGWCRPLDAIDFEHRDWLPASGWPFSRQHLEPYYTRAQEIFCSGVFNYYSARWPSGIGDLLSATRGAFEETVFQMHPTRFRRVYEKAARRSRALDVVLNATVVDLKAAARGDRVSEARVVAFDHSRFDVRARVFVLAAGGIENARLLLVSQGPTGRALGNEHDLVGRYFTDHIHVPIGVVEADEDTAARCQPRMVNGTTVRSGVVASEAWRRQERTLGVAVTFHNADDPHDVLSLAQTSRSYASLHHLVQSLRHGRPPDRLRHHLTTVLRHPSEVCRLTYRRLVKRPARALIIGCRAEQAPHRDSRVRLDRSCDGLGVRRARLEWKITPADLDHITRAQQLLADALGDRRVTMFPRSSDDGRGWRHTLAGGAHHMGTTRMHQDPTHGVVDANSRVHSVHNLFVTGSSVFPTGGWAPPTLTIVAMAARLADHLSRTASRGQG